MPSEGRQSVLRNKIQWSPTGKEQKGSMNLLQIQVWKPPFQLTDQAADWGYSGCKVQAYKFSHRTWLSCWQGNKTHTLRNSPSQERRKSNAWAALPRPAEQRSSCPPPTHLYAPTPFLLTVEAALPTGQIHIRPEDAPGSAETVLLKPLHAPAAVHRSLRSEYMQWLKYFDPVFMTSMSDLL